MGLINFSKPSIAKQKMHEYIWLIAGRNKAGKTTLATKFKNPYFFMFEPGTSALLTYETDVLKTANKLDKMPWEVFKEAIDEFVENDGYGFKTVIADPYGVAYKECEKYVCKREGISDPGDLEWGKGYRLVRKEFEDITNKLISNEYTILFITHIDTKNKKNGIGGEKDIVDLDISGKAGDFIRNMVDIFLLADFDENGERKLFVRPTTDKEAGSRLDFGVDKIDLDYDILVETFNEAVKRNNKKLGITDEMIEQFYQDKEEEKKLESIKGEIIELCGQKNINLIKHKKFLKERYGYDTMDNINFGMEQALDYKEFVLSQ